MAASGSAESRTAHFRPDIQGLRAVAVLLVLLYHAGLPWVSGGYVGVDIFFVISGFLITSHIVREVDLKGRLDLVAFYARRARRILPAALAVLAVSMVVAYLVIPPFEREGLLQDAAATALYVPNMLFAVQDTDYLASEAPSIFQHYWSLGIEEQFYLFWPVVLTMVLKFLGHRRWALWAAVGGLVAASFVGCLALMSVSESWAFFALPTRAWELGVGALVAIAVSRGVRVSSPVGGVAAWGGLAAAAAAGFLLTDATSFPGVATLLPVLGTAAVILCGTARLSPAWLLERRPMQFVGAISYSLYLVHWPMVLIPQTAVEGSLPEWLKVALSALAVPVAYLCYRFVETPFRRAPSRTRVSHRRTVAVSLAASVALGAVSATSAGAVARIPIHSGNEAPEYAGQPNPSGTPYVPANMSPDLRSAPEDNPEIYRDGCLRDTRDDDGSGCQEGADPAAPTVALFGDSHAANWHPALRAIADDGQIELDVNAKSSCESVATENSPNDYPTCAEWRDNVIERLHEDPPDVIMLANYAAHHSADAEDREQYWQDALEHTIERLPQESQVLIMVDTPTMPAVPMSCLSRHVEDAERCAANRETTLEEGLDAPTRQAERTVAEDDGRVDRVDLTAYFCNDETCPAVIDDRLVYRDTHHLTRTFSDAMRPAVEEALVNLVDGIERTA
ncbi:acyltransferase family protein [Georgenia alba]|uniref:Acyltransferase family protein n=1 Tax=Georgenia alba TaxID=2233858 RepID=A0ABW2Q5G2_9MICO